MKFKVILSVATATFVVGMNPSYATDSNSNAVALEQLKQMSISEMISTYRSQLGESVYVNEQQANSQSRVVTQYDVFKYRLARMIGGSQFSAIEIVGFSGAGYNDIERFKEQVRGQILVEAERVKDGKVVLVLGGSIDGIGAAYDVAEKLRAEGMKNLVVVGMVAQEVVKYQLEGKIQGWGDVLSPKQDLLLLVDNSRNGQQGSWELTEKPNGSSRTVDIVLDLTKLQNNVSTRFQVYEGGEQSIKETIELAARSSSVAADKRINIDLIVGHEPAEKQVKKGKDKGFRAATQLVEFLASPERVASSNANVSVRFATDMASYSRKIDATVELFRNPEAILSNLQERVRAEEAKDPKSAETNIAKAELARATTMLSTESIILENLKRSLMIVQSTAESSRTTMQDAINDHRGYKDLSSLENARNAQKSFEAELRQIRSLETRIQELETRIRERAITSKIK